jgi:hypothetical protein
LCARHFRLHIDATWCDDAEWQFERCQGRYSLDAVIAWCRTLAAGARHEMSEEAWGRVYRTIFSLDSHIGEEAQDPTRQFVWFYPMTEARLALGIEVGSSIPALRACLAWARDHLHVVEAGACAGISSGLATCLALLDDADHRLGRVARAR